MRFVEYLLLRVIGLELHVLHTSRGFWTYGPRNSNDKPISNRYVPNVFSPVHVFLENSAKTGASMPKPEPSTVRPAPVVGVEPVLPVEKRAGLVPESLRNGEHRHRKSRLSVFIIT